jgi:hypothetical protein
MIPHIDVAITDQGSFPFVDDALLQGRARLAAGDAAGSAREARSRRRDSE